MMSNPMKAGRSVWPWPSALEIALSVLPAFAQKKYDIGATDAEIKVGQTVPFSGPVSAYATIGKAQAAYMKMVNDRGGVNGRKINLIQYDDAYSPPKTVEQARKLVESDEVLLTFQLIGTPSNPPFRSILTPRRFRSSSPPPEPRASAIRRTIPGRSASTPATSRRTHLRPLHSQEPSGCQDRRALPE